MRKNDDDLIRKYMEIRVEGIRPRKTWLENVKAKIAELEMDRKKWRWNVIKKKSNPIRKWDYKPIIIITIWNLARYYKIYLLCLAITNL